MTEEEIQQEAEPETASPEKNGQGVAVDLAKSKLKKKGGWFQKIPRDVLFSPGGLVLLLLAFIGEVGDLIPLPILDQIWEVPMEIIFIVLLMIIAKDLSYKSLIIPAIIERIPGISDLLPTWIIKLLM